MSYLNWSLALKTKSCSYWHEWSAFQSIAVRAVDWHDNYFHYSFPPLSHRRSARIKKLVVQKLTRAPKKHWVHHFLDPVGHFGAPWRPFWILQAVRCCRRWASAPYAARLVLGIKPLSDLYDIQRLIMNRCSISDSGTCWVRIIG